MPVSSQKTILIRLIALVLRDVPPNSTVSTHHGIRGCSTASGGIRLGTALLTMTDTAGGIALRLLVRHIPAGRKLVSPAKNPCLCSFLAGHMTA